MTTDQVIAAALDLAEKITRQPNRKSGERLMAEALLALNVRYLAYQAVLYPTDDLEAGRALLTDPEQKP